VTDRSVHRICEAIAIYKVELLPATPSFLTMLMAARVHTDYDLSSLKRITYGTEVMPQTTLDRLGKAFPNVVLQQTYGLSEVGVLRSESRGDGTLWVRIGGDGFKTKVINGVLWIKSEYAMIGYLNSPSEFDNDGWFNTQDQVDVDGDFFRILGRVSDLINVGGQKVYPTEVENVILEIGNIYDVAVYGEKNNFLGQVVVAKILLDQPESIESVKKRVRQACLAKLLPYKVPSKIILTDEALHNSRQKKMRK
jgi:acyl-CoA synthetase (AMP-forming)/AMP-acid ligase II